MKHYLKSELYELIKKDEHIFDFIQGGSLDGLWYWDLEKPEHEWMNARFWEVLGYKPEEMPHKASAWQNIINQDDLKVAIDNFNKHLANQNHPYDQEVRYTHKDGHIVWIRCRGMAIRDEQGNPVRMLGIHQDITRLKQANEKLQLEKESAVKNEEKYKAMFENAPLAYQSLNEEGYIIEVNPTWLNTLQYKKEEEVIGKWFGDFLHPDYTAHFRKNFPIFKKQGSISNVQLKMLKKTGEIINVTFEGCIGYDKDNNFRQTYCTFKDITEQKQAEDKLLFLNQSISELITINKKEQLSDHFTTSIHSIYPNAIILYVSVDEAQKNAKLESISGLSKTILSKVHKIAGRTFIGKPYKLSKKHEEIFRKGCFHTYEGGLAEFSNNELPNAVSNAIQKLLKIHRIYTIGIKKNETLLGAVHIFTLNDTKIADGNFLETYIAQFASVVQNLNLTSKFQKNEEVLRKTLSTVPDIIIRTDTDGNILYANEALEKQFPTLSDEKILGKNMLDFIVEKDIPRTLENTKLMFEHPLGIQEYQMQIDDENIYDFAINGDVLRDANAQPTGMVYVLRNITASKEAEKKIKEKNEQLETIIKGANLGWYDWDIPSGNEIYNDILTENLGYKLSEIRPHIKWWKNKIHPDDAKQVSIDLQKHLAGKTKFYENKHRLKTKNEKWLWFHDFGKVVQRDADGNAIRMIGTLQNIDYEERAKEKINSSLQQITVITANTPNIIWKSDIDNKGNFKNTYISGAADDFLALPKGSIKNSWDKYFPYILPEYLPTINKLFKESAQSPDKQFSFDYKVKKANGELAWFSSSGKTVFENKKLSVYGSTIDITEKKQAETDLLQSEIRFKALHNASFGGIAIHDKGVILECNDGLSKISGYSRDELIGMEGLLLIAEETRDKVMQNISSGYEKPYEAIGARKNGEKYPLRLEAKQIPYKGKNARVVEFRDITEQKEAENKLIESEEMLRNIFNNSTSIIYSHDTNGLVNYVSPQVEEILGFTQDEAKVHWTNFLSDNPINKIGYKKTMMAIKTGKKQAPYELEFIHKNGRKVLIEAREAPLVMNGNTVSIVGIFNDITKRKQNEIELKNAKKRAEESEQLKSAFLANMSHEIRTPMNGILGFTDLLKEPNLSGEEKEKYIDIIRKSGNRMLETVNDIIDISKIDAGQMEISNGPVDINEKIKTHFEFFNVEAKAKGLELKLFNNLPEHKIIIISDKNKLNSIISNLIKNAIKYTDKGSIEIHCGKKDSNFEFKINDTGIGISKKRIAAVFNRFEQADITDTHIREGSGLGLSITHAYIEMLGGNIGVESELGVGSTFYFNIPWKDNQKDAHSTTTETFSKTNNDNLLNILVAEDDDISFMHLEIVLNKFAKSINRVLNGKEVLDYVRNNTNIDVILMDVNMPLMNGYEATSKIREFNKDIIIIAQTAYALEGDKEKAIEAGCDDYITKPINSNHLVELINKHLKN